MPSNLQRNCAWRCCVRTRAALPRSVPHAFVLLRFPWHVVTYTADEPAPEIHTQFENFESVHTHCKIQPVRIAKYFTIFSSERKEKDSRGTFFDPENSMP